MGGVTGQFERAAIHRNRRIRGVNARLGIGTTHAHWHRVIAHEGNANAAIRFLRNGDGIRAQSTRCIGIFIRDFPRAPRNTRPRDSAARASRAARGSAGGTRLVTATRNR